MRHVVVMGVSGTGKTTIGERIAKELSMHFIEGDTFHPKSNIEKMSSGVPLDDDDRRPWLEALAGEIRVRDEDGIATVTACSALRRLYRDWLRGNEQRELFFVHLNTDYNVLLDRMEKRSHFMPPSLLQSQFDTLEPLEGDEDGVVIDDDATIGEVVALAVSAIETSTASQTS